MRRDLIFGLTLSIILMATAANLISKLIKDHKWIAWIGLIAILIVAIQLILTDNAFNIFDGLKTFFNV